MIFVTQHLLKKVSRRLRKNYNRTSTQKNDKCDCKNYRGISLLSAPGKVYTKMIQERLKRYVNRIDAEEQAGFRAGRGTIDQIIVMRQLSEKFYEKNRTLHNNFIDFKQAFDSVWQEGL